MVAALLQGGVEVHTLRDITRGGLGTVLCELAEAANCGIEIDETAIPVHEDVRAFAHILGLELLHMGNEGKLLAAVPAHQANRALELLRASRYGAEAAVIGTVTNGEGVVALTPIGGKRRSACCTAKVCPEFADFDFLKELFMILYYTGTATAAMRRNCWGTS